MTVWQQKLDTVKEQFRISAGTPGGLVAKADGSIWQCGGGFVTKLVTQSLAIHYLRTSGFVDTRTGWVPREHLEAQKVEAA